MNESTKHTPGPWSLEYESVVSALYAIAREHAQRMEAWHSFASNALARLDRPSWTCNALPDTEDTRDDVRIALDAVTRAQEELDAMLTELRRKGAHK